MSVCNVYLDESRAFVGVDTDVDGPRGRAEFAKSLYLAHMGVMLAVRGQQYALIIALGTLYERPEIENFDQLRDAGAAIGTRMGQGIGAVPMGHLETDVFAVGWSDRASRMAAVQWSKPAGSKRYTMTDVPSARFGPAAEIAEVPARMTAEVMADLMRCQVAHCREEHPTAAIGGRMVFAELTRGAAAIRTLPL